MTREPHENALVTLYTDRFGEPFTADEVYGYWVFVVGAVLAVVGMGLFVTSMGQGQAGTRQWAFVLTGLGLASALAGLVVGQSFNRSARYVVYLGVLSCLTAVAWFVSIYPAAWALDSPAARNVVIVYTIGLALIALSGTVAPIVVGQSRARRAIAEELAAARSDDADDDARIAELEQEVATRENRVEELEGELAEVTGRAANAADALARLEDSDATFDVYRDRSGKWRWRLVHQNGNIIATSGESYASDRNCRRGMRSVQRHALGAAIVWQRDEEEPEPLVDPVAEESRATFERYDDARGEARWRLRHDNGEIIAAGTRGFSSNSAALDSIESVRAYVGPADYLEFDPAGIQVYEDASGEYRWRLVHRNGEILADSGEGYASRSNARRAIERLKDLAGDASIDDESGARYEVYEAADGEHRWRLVAANGETIADSGEGYADRRGAVSAIERVQEYTPAADTLTVGEAAVEIYEDDSGEHRWRLRHRNGTILATSGEGYSSRSKAIAGVNTVKRNAPAAPVEDRGAGETGDAE